MTSNSDPGQGTDPELIARCLAGDAGAFGPLVERHRPRLVRLLRALLHQPDQIDDLWQETLLRAYFNLDQLRDRARFGAWLCTIAANLARTARSSQGPRLLSWDELTGRQLSQTQPRPALDQAVEEQLSRDETVQRVRQAIADLPAAEQAAIVLVYLEGFSHKEVATELGVQLSAVKVRVHRGRQRLQRALQAVSPASVSQRARKAKMIKVEIYDILRRQQPLAAQPVPINHPWQPGELTQVPDPRIVVLKESGGERVLPIWIGTLEGELLAMHLLQQEIKRPMTYDLMRTLLDLAQVTVDRVLIARLHEETYYSTLTVKLNGTTADIDCRPSDAINLAVRLSLPIFVAAEVMDQAGKPLGEPINREIAWASVLQTAES
jgi:RNA polymerase sigma factor (sigma-70 family)